MYDQGSDDRWERGWRRFERMARRFGNGAGFGPRGWENFGGHFRIGRMLASGDVRLVALFFIEQQPRHGYDLIRAIEEKSQGFYSPSPGVIYPALTFLEEAGYVTGATEGNKKLYTVTDEGRTHLDENRDAVRATLDFLERAGAEVKKWRDMARENWPFTDEQRAGFSGPHEGAGPRQGGHGSRRPDRDLPGAVPELNEARRELKAALREAIRLSNDDQARVAAILRRAASDIREAGRESVDDIDL